MRRSRRDGARRRAPLELSIGASVWLQLGCGTEDAATSASSQAATYGSTTHGAIASTTADGDASGSVTDAPDTTATAGDSDGSTGEIAFQLPPPDAGLDYQLGGAYPPPRGVQIVSRDRTAAPAMGLYNICYVNGFQSQPGEDDFWLDEHPDLVLRDEGGEPVTDPDWDEMLLDTSTPQKREALAAIAGGWITECAQDGYQAIEIDNLDTYARSGGRLTQDDAVDYMALLSAAAHGAGVAIAQKNSTEILDRAAEMATDFAVAEECSVYDECADYVDVYGDGVLMIEYGEADFEAGCSGFPGHSIVLRDLYLSTPEGGDYVYAGC